MRVIAKYLFLLSALLVVISCDKEVYTGITEMKVVYNTSFNIVSNPEGSVILIDGKNSGFSTPDSIKWLAPGDHEIRLRNYLFEDTTFTVILADGESNNTFIDYTANPGNFATIKCSTLPNGAEIFINDSATGKVTPYVFTGMYPGDYKIKYTYPEHRADSVSFFVKGKHSFSSSVTLDDTSQVVDYREHNTPITTNLINDAAVDADGVVWVGSATEGVFRFDGKDWSVFDNENSVLPNNNINCVTVDSENKIFIGTNQGLAVYNNGSWSNYNITNSQLPNNFVSSVTEDNNGNYWIGTQGGLAKMTGGTIVKYTTQNSGLASNIVTSVAVSGNNVYAGTAAGVSMYDGAKWTKYDSTNTPFTGNTVGSVCVDNNGILYVGLSLVEKKTGPSEPGGVFYFDGSSWKEITVARNLGVKSVYIDKYDVLWICTQSGLIKAENFVPVKLFNKSNSGLTVNHVRKVFLSSGNQLWVSTYGGGLLKFKEGYF